MSNVSNDPLSDFTMKQKALVSVGIPVYNGEKHIHGAIDSILEQSYKNIQIVISDNASTDKTQDICNDYCKKHPNIKYVRQPCNIGSVENFKSVLQMADGEYFMWLGHDDYLSRNYVEICLQKLIEHPDYALVSGMPIYVYDDNRKEPGGLWSILSDDPLERVVSYFEKVTDNGIFYGIIKKEHAERLCLRMRLGDDWLIVASLAFIGKLFMCNEAEIYRHVGGASSSISNAVRAVEDPFWVSYMPYLTIAFYAYSDIAFRNNLFSEIGVFERQVLAIKCQSAIRKKFRAQRIAHVVLLIKHACLVSIRYGFDALRRIKGLIFGR